MTVNSAVKSNSSKTTIVQPKIPQIIQQKPTALRLKALKKNTGALKNEAMVPNKQYQPLTPTETNSKNKRQTCPLNLTKINSPTTHLINGQKN